MSAPQQGPAPAPKPDGAIDTGLSGTRPARLEAGLRTPGSFPPDVPTVLYSDPRSGGDGSYCVNGDKAQVGWRWRIGQLSQVFPCSLPSNGEPQPIIVDYGAQGLSGDSEAAFLWYRETFGPNNRIAVKPRVGAPFYRDLANVPIPGYLAFGTSLLPGLLPSPLRCFVNSEINFNAQDASGLGGEVEMGAFCRAFDDTGCEAEGDARKRAWMDEKSYPAWVGPQDKLNPSLTGPAITLAPGATASLTFPAPSDADFLVAAILDDSTSTTGLEPKLAGIIMEGDTREQLIDDNNGINWRNFIACPTVTVAGMPTGGVIRAMSLKSPRGGWTHQIRRNSNLSIKIISTDDGTVTLRIALVGWMLPFAEPSDRRFAPSVDRNVSAPAEVMQLGGGR